MLRLRILKKKKKKEMPTQINSTYVVSFYDLQDYLQPILRLNYNCNIYIILWKIVEDKKIVSDIRFLCTNVETI